MVDYRTLVNCEQSRQVSRRMRQALQEFREAAVGDDGPEVVGSDGEEDGDAESLGQRVAVLEAENRALWETVEARAGQPEELGRRVAALEDKEQPRAGSLTVGVGQVQQREWRPPRRRLGMPDAGVGTLEERPDEEHAFGPAAPLVAEWQEVRNRSQAAAGSFNSRQPMDNPFTTNQSTSLSGISNPINPGGLGDESPTCPDNPVVSLDNY